MADSKVCILGVIMVSLYLYAALLPYKTMHFNLTECTLLSVAALMTGIVSGLILACRDCCRGCHSLIKQATLPAICMIVLAQIGVFPIQLLCVS